MTKNTPFYQDVLVEPVGSAGIVRLNRPKALNSLTLGMIRTISMALDRFEHDPDIAVVVIAGEGEKAFCAGGDIRAFYESGKARDGLAETFWREEFALNRRIANYSKPYVALMDGIVMGGGVGLSAHGRYRIVTETTRLAMPEVAIGYVPDVGATWLLPRAPGNAGIWMGLTGLEIGAADAIHAGFADFHIARFRLPDLLEVLSRLPRHSSGGDVETAIANLCDDPAEGVLIRHADVTARCFRFGDVESIFDALASEKGDFAISALEAMSLRSPTSLKVSRELMLQGAQSRSLEECLNRELGAALRSLDSDDFYEGIRAAVIDKDRQPRWSHREIGDVPMEAVRSFFVAPVPPLFPSQTFGTDEKVPAHS